MDKPTSKLYVSKLLVDPLYRGRVSSSKESFASFHNTDCTHRTHPSSVDAFRGLQLPPPLKIASLLVVPSYSFACSVVDDSLWDNLLFGIKPHSRYKTSNVVPEPVSLPIDSATIHAVTWCHRTCSANIQLELWKETDMDLYQAVAVREEVVYALTKKDRTLLVKLFYQNGSNHLAALLEYRRLKDLRKGPISKIGLRKMTMKFEETGNLGVLP
ncbi:uncharacterized protein TNCV_3375811 [Trichonephila clavipes]|nr:uncharacterized protein TNCV_3375811 [Trichonephila clavipes]